jgi:hypothetical protein
MIRIRRAYAVDAAPARRTDEAMGPLIDVVTGPLTDAVTGPVTDTSPARGQMPNRRRCSRFARCVATTVSRVSVARRN